MSPETCSKSITNDKQANQRDMEDQYYAHTQIITQESKKKKKHKINTDTTFVRNHIISLNTQWNAVSPKHTSTTVLCYVSGHQNVSDSDDDDRSVTSVLTRSDAGLYTCVVKNIAGHVAHNVSLFIEGQTQSPFFSRDACASAAYAVVRCLSVRHVRVLCWNG